ncbi:MAG: cupin domain-containing protein [Terriglobales bacterium]|jgi:quercetin dioxygenase-like cupin family protein
MARVFTLAEGKQLGLPGRNSIELLSAEKGTHSVTLRLVEIPIAEAQSAKRAPHSHSTFEECIFVLSGQGITHADSGEYALKAGDTIWIPAGEKHYTRNSGNVPLRLLCFFPVGDVSSSTSEPGLPSGSSAAV